MKKCGRCSIEKPISCFNKDKYTKTGYRSQCKDCMKDERVAMKSYYKKWRSTDEKRAWYVKYRRERNKENRVKRSARNALNYAIRNGTIIRPDNCKKCKKLGIIHGHHPDYSKPLEVIWLCPPCHTEEHERINNEQ